MLEKNNNKLNLACAAVAVAVLLFDLSLPLGVAGGVPYVALVLLGMWAPTIRYIYFLATLGTALTIVGYVLSDAGGVPWVVLVNRGLAFFVIWTTAILLALRNQGQDALARSRDDLEGHALQHTIENRENEDRYRAFSDLSSEGVAIINGGTIIEANQAFASMYGYSISKLIGKPVLELVVPEQRENITDQISQNSSVTFECHGFRKDGSIVPVEVKTMPITYKGHRMLAARLRDLTEAHEAVEAIRIGEERLRHAQKMEAVGQLTGGVAHDFNNLLAAIIGNLDLIDVAAITSKNDRESIAVALWAAQSGAELTYRLLAFSRNQPLHAKAAQVNDALPRFYQLAKRTIGEDITIEIKPDKDLWLIMVDVGQLEAAILNLAINARDAMPDGGQLTVETSNQVLCEKDAARFEDLTPGDYVMITVRDNGGGMSPEVLEQAIEPFYTTKGVGEGSGLGLSTVFGFARQSQGQIEIDSVEGQGTTVRIYLPRTYETISGDLKSEAAEQGNPSGNETILVVEDESDVLNYIVKALNRFGYNMLQAKDGPTALEVMASCDTIDLLLTDVILPQGMNGREIADAFQRQFPTACVLYSSGYTREVLGQRSQIDDHMVLINKPYGRHVLARQVREILDDRQKEDIL